MPVDRWGAVPIPVAPMSAPSVAAVIAAHRNGSAPRHPAHSERIRYATDADAPPPAMIDHEAPTPPDNGYYDAGTAARRDAAAAMGDIADIIDDIDRRTEQMLLRTMDLLEAFQAS